MHVTGPTKQQKRKRRWRPSRWRRRKEFKQQMYEEQGGRCFMCGHRMLPVGSKRNEHPRFPTFEHLVPKHMGGTDAQENLMLSCLACNRNRAGNPEYRLASVFCGEGVLRESQS